MLISDLRLIGANLYAIRKKKGLTQAEVAELAELSDRTYADIERGNVNMRIETVLKLCAALNVSPNSIFVEEQSTIIDLQHEVLERLDQCSSDEKITALQLLSVYLNSL